MPQAEAARRKRHCIVFPARILITACVIGVLVHSLSAKDIPINAIVLYDTPAGAAYVQMTDVMLNGKTELRSCTLGSKVDKSDYGRLAKVQLKGAASLERNVDGVLILTGEDQQQVCVVPSNLHLDRDNAFSPSELAEQAALGGIVVAASENGPKEIPPVKRGIRLVFVAAADTELAEFLLCQRANSIPVWQKFLSRFATSSHASDARTSLAALFEKSAETAFAQYQKSTGTPDWAMLKEAHELAEQAMQSVPSYAPSVALLEKIKAELDTFAAKDRAELAAYRKALQDRTAGYVHLPAARLLDDEILGIDPQYSPALDVQTELTKETANLDTIFQKSEGLLAAKRSDEAVQALGAYRNFAPEVPRIEAVVAAVYDAHIKRGKEYAGDQDWEHAVPEYRRALETRPDSQEARTTLQDAEVQLTNARNRKAADDATAASNTYKEQTKYIEAYEVLADLTPQQRILVADQLEALKNDFVTAAVKRAQTLQEVHFPIRGRADEDDMREAYLLLDRASSLTDDPGVRLKRDLLADKISDYYTALAKRFLERPRASGIGLGWCYLEEVEQFKPNLPFVKDQMTTYESAYQMRAKLSLGVEIRDPTSHRESVGFAEQLVDSVATDLESSGLQVKVVRPPILNAEPVFKLVAEINQRPIAKNVTQETLQSKYRAGTHEVKSEAWLKANRDYEAAQQEVEAAQRELYKSTKKKDIATAKDALTAAQKKVTDARLQRDAINETRSEPVIESYNYTRTTYDLTGVIAMAFRIEDADGTLIEQVTPPKQEKHRNYVVLGDVKPEDAEGVKKQDLPPDESAFVTDLEIQATDLLVKSIHEKVAGLPAKVLEEAHKHVQRNDLEGAAEWYVIYLNATPATSGPDRDEALKYLRDHFDVGCVKPS